MTKAYISVYLRNSEEGPSCYYRIMQYINEIDGYEFKINNAFTTKEYRRNMNLKSVFFKKIYQFILLIKVMYRRYRDIKYDLKNHPDCIIISREVYPRFAFRFLTNQLLELLSCHKVIWDFDDDILAFGEISKAEMENLERCADQIIVTHQHLKETLKSNCYDRTMVLPTTDKGCMINKFAKITSDRENLLINKVNLVWIGTSSNLEFLDIVVEALDKVSAEIKSIERKDVYLYVVCNTPYQPKKKICELQIKNYKWERDKANKIMKISHVGIMPLKQSKIAEGKGAFKLIQYLSFGIPIIASPVGFNKEVVDERSGFLADTDEEWKDALKKLTADIRNWRKFAQNARENYEQNFSYSSHLAVWKNLIKEAVGEA